MSEASTEDVRRLRDLAPSGRVERRPMGGLVCGDRGEEVGELGIPALQILGGLMMAAAFSLRWSVIPAMIVHGMGNLFVGVFCLTYVQLFEAYPSWFLPQ